MNNKFLLTLMIVTLIVTACASNLSTPASDSNSSTLLPMQTQLIIGTLKLEGTANAVTSAQAAELLPMWYVLQDLNSSEAAAQAEIDGLVSQIKETMTKDQIQAISDMKLGTQDMMTALQENGGILPSSSQAGSTSSVIGGNVGGPPDMGGDIPVDPSGMPGVMPSTGISSPSSDTRSMPIMDNSTPSALFDAVIVLLQKKIE